MPRSPQPQRSPTAGLLLGLVLTLAAVVAYSAYIVWQIKGLRQLQSDLADRNRKDSLQLLRVQNDLNSLALAMRDMLDADEPYPLSAWSAQFQRIRNDLDDALRREEQVALVERSPEQREFLRSSLAQFWDAVARTFTLAQNGKQDEARSEIRISLQARQAALSTAVARLLVQNNEYEEQVAARTAEIYDRVQRQVYIFLGATLIAIVLTSLYLMQSNRRLFAQLAALSAQRRDLAQKLIATQESTLRYVSRELHDEFGQILTAVGSMLGRAEKHTPEGSPLRTELHEVREIAQNTLQTVRSLSQALHPVMLDEAGLEATLDWYLPTVERQTGITISYEKSGDAFPLVERGSGTRLPYCARGFEQRHPPFRIETSLGAAALSGRIAGPGNRRPWHRIRRRQRPPGNRTRCHARARTTGEWQHRISASHNRRHAGKVACSPRGRRNPCLKKFPCCWWTTMPWSVKASAACSRMKPTWSSSAKRATAWTP